MLSQHDRRALAEIEARVRSADPAFARRLEHAFEEEKRPARGKSAWLRVGLGAAVLSLALLAAAFAVHSADAAVSGVVVLLLVASGVVVWAVSRLRHRHGR